MSKYGLVGNKISYSFSPKLHMIIKDIFNLEYSYDLVDIEKEDFNFNKISNYQGLNVTIPFKEIFASNNDIVHSPIVKDVKALNTLYYVDGILHSDNTDYYGFKYLIESNNIDTKDKKIAILGTGGAAKICYYYLNQFSKFVYFVSRSHKSSNTISYEQYNDFNFDLIINATPVGTSPNLEDSPLIKKQVKNKIVVDLIYNPSITKLMSFASEAYNGLDMLIVQALYAQQRWNGNKIIINDYYINLIKERILNV